MIANIIKTSTGNAIRIISQRCYSGPSTARGTSPNHTPNVLERRFLVWSGHYKSLKDVPALVPIEKIEKSRNKARIRIANFMMLATIVACAITVYLSKRAANRGDNVAQWNIDWHKDYDEKNK